MARYDKLLKGAHMREKTVSLMPTWRHVFETPFSPVTGKRDKNPAFITTAYYTFYNSLINDIRLIETLEKEGYRGEFIIHPALIQEADTFAQNQTFKVVEDVSYQDIFRRSALVVTDYSSVAFDFAALQKPVVYTQFDRDDFFSAHTYSQGYFDYERDGFGPVCTSYDETVDEIIRLVKDGCQLNTKYAERVDRFFTPPISNCCEKTLAEILKL
jgi:CDP-glycerol glycerophosphotransferase (TagB/SpsB family)